MQDVYNTIAKEFDKTRHTHWNCVKQFVWSLKPSTLVADVGCGNGKNETIRTDITILANDISTELLTIAKAKNSTHKSFNSEYIMADGTHLGYRDSIFDAAICIAVIHHCSAPKQVVSEIMRTMRPGARLLFTVWAYEQEHKPKWVNLGNGDFLIPWQDSVHRPYHLFTKEEVLELIQDFKLVSMTFECNNHCVILEK